MPQYLPLQPVQPRLDQQTSNIFPSYGQFPSTYPYNTVNPQFFQQTNHLVPNMPAQPTTVNPSAGLYAPIPFIGQSLHPGVQNIVNYNSNGANYHPLPISNNQSVINQPTANPPAIREDVYLDDTRDIKRPKIEIKRIVIIRAY